MMQNALTALAISAGDVGIPKVEANQNTLGQVIASVFLLIGGMAVLFLLIGAVRYATSNGEQARITQAKNTILYAIVGIVVSSLGFIIVQFVIGKIVGSI